MEYIYKIEVDCFKFSGVYGWRMLCRKKDDATDKWGVCAAGSRDTIEAAFAEAYYYQRQYEAKRKLYF